MSRNPSPPSHNHHRPRVLVVGPRDRSAADLHEALCTDPTIEVAGPVIGLGRRREPVVQADLSAVVVVARHENATLWRTLMGFARPPRPIPVVVVAPEALRTTAFLTGAEDWLLLDDDRPVDAGNVVRAIHNAVIRRRVSGGLPSHGHLHGLVSGVAHEVNNPLTVIHANLEEACENLQDLIFEQKDAALKEELDALHEMLLEDQEAAQRIGTLSRGLQTLARLADTVPSALHTGPVMRRVLRRFQQACPDAPAPRIYGRTDWRVHASVHGFEEALFHVLENAQNAQDIAGCAEAVEIEFIESFDNVRVHIRDRGPGIRSDLQGRALSPFVTSHLPGEGLGLGLTLTALALRRAGGDVSLDARPGGGTDAQLTFLPARAQAPLLYDEDDTEDLAAR
jgi:signal transduction histidine kinase